MANRRFGWHSGTLKCKDIVVQNDLEIQGDLAFGDATTDTLTVTGLMTVTQAAMTENTKAVDIDAEITDATHGARQGALKVELGRSIVMTGSDGNPDTAVKIISSDYSDAGSGFARVRGMDLKAQNDGENANSSVFINAAYITAECATGMANSGNMSVAELNMKNNGTIGGTNVGLLIQDQSQGATTGDTFGIKIAASNYAITREHAISIGATGGTWTNILHVDDVNNTNLIMFDAVGGCLSADTGSPAGTTINKIKIDMNGTAGYIPVYADY